MTNKTKGVACVAFTAVALAAMSSAHAEAPTNEELLQRIERLENLLTQKEEADAKQDKSISALEAKPKEDWFLNTKISGRMYYNISSSTLKRDGVKDKSDGTGFDIKRFYVGIDHKFNDTFSANITTDFLYDSGSGATQIYIKKAYVEANLSPAFKIRLGSADLPWIPFVEGLYGYRYVENVLVDRTKFGTSADWGVHVSGKLANGLIEYAVSAIDGSGYKHPLRSKSIDVEGRVSLNYQNFTLGVGGYTGKLGKDMVGTTTYHTASRLDVVAAYTGHGFRVGAEAFFAKNWNNVTNPVADKSDGIGAFASYQFTKEFAVFGRYDWVRPNKLTNHALTDNYFNVGIAYTPTKIVDFALVYKRDKADDGFLATSNGTIGGAVNLPGHDGTYEEFGLWGRVRW